MANTKSTARRLADSIAETSARIETTLDDMPFAGLRTASTRTEADLAIANTMLASAQEMIAAVVERESCQDRAA